MVNWKVIAIGSSTLATLSIITVIVVSVVLSNKPAQIQTEIIYQTVQPSPITNVNPNPNPSPNTTEKICTSKECIQAANMILKNIDTSVDPCEDFNKFACGSFLANSRIPDDQTGLDSFGDLRTTLSYRVSDQLESGIGGTEIAATANAKRFYRSCMNESNIEEQGEKQFVDVLTKELGGWPLLSLSYIPSQSLVQKLAEFMKRSQKPLVQLTVTSYPKKPGEYRLAVSQPSWFLSKKYYEDTNVVNAYKEYMTKVAQYMAAATNVGGSLPIKSEIEAVFQLETRLAGALLTEEEKRNLTYAEYSIKELESAFPQFEWRNLIISGIYASSAISFSEDEKLIVYDENYLKKAGPIISSASSSNYERKILDSLLAWSFIRDRSAYLPKKYKDARLEFDKVYSGLTTIAPRSRTCANAALDRMPYAVGRLYVAKYFDENSKNQAAEMIENIRSEFKEILKEIDWMDAESKKKAEEKADFIDVKIGYPEFTYNDTYLNNLYKEFAFSENNFIENNMIALKAEANDNFKKLRDARNLKDWFSGPAVVNAFYEPELNQICFPAGILQAPFYDGKAPKYLNYGGIGIVIGHEVTHGFDDQGRLYDKDGVFIPDGEVGLWSDTTIQNYKTKADCIVNQYSNYKAEQVGLNLNGAQTQGENIADNGGIRESFRAYKRWEAKNGKEPLLPGLPYTQEQLFFINHGQVWCSKYRDATLIQRIRTGVHSPGEFRIRGPTSNHDEFAKAFQCKQNTGNNPNNKCIVW